MSFSDTQGPRPPTENEYGHLLEFLDQQLRPHADWSIASEYPTALAVNNLHNISMITRQEKVISHALIRPHIVRTPTAIFKIAAIGSVVTEPSYRNQGLSQKCLNACLRNATEQDCDLAVLWTDLYDFYRKLDFELAGTEISFTLDRKIECDSGIRVEKDVRVSPELLLNLYVQHSVITARNTRDVRRYLEIPNTRIHLAFDASNQCMAYAIEGKGADLQGYIHEWGGHIEGVLACVESIRKHHNTDQVTLITPAHAVNLIHRLQSQGFLCHHGFLGMIRILNVQKVLDKVIKASRIMGVTEFNLAQPDKETPQFTLQIGQTQLRVEGLAQLIRVLFGPWNWDDLPQISSQHRHQLSQFLPLPLWLWGWDSV